MLQSKEFLVAWERTRRRKDVLYAPLNSPASREESLSTPTTHGTNQCSLKSARSKLTVDDRFFLYVLYIIDFIAKGTKYFSFY
mmetsp:Transcript_25435/g.37708  ORF Transcript_25435/g.37708 Transcript_25435/m.37708 type:complete len:83 (+) Transcript_25435:317-565(+)